MDFVKTGLRVRGVQPDLRAAEAPVTLRAYRFDWQHFKARCEGRELSR